MKTSRFDEILKALHAFEDGMAQAKIKSRSAVNERLSKISLLSTALMNEGSLPPGTKSTLLKIRNLCKDTVDALDNGRISSLTDVRLYSRDTHGPAHTMLRKQLTGKETAADKAQMREYTTDEDKAPQINRLLEAFDPGSRNYGGETLSLDEIKARVAQFLDLHFSAAQLRSIRPYAQGENTPGGEPKKDPNCEWNHVTFKDIADASGSDPKSRARLSALKRELVQKHDDAMATIALSYRDMNRRLPSKMRVPFEVIYFPVVPLFDDAMGASNKRLINAGLDVTYVGDHFPVLENQLLLCLDLDKLGIKEAFKKVGNHEEARLKTVNNKDETLMRINHIIGDINGIAERNGQRFALASDRIVRNPKNPRIALAWLLDERIRKKLASVLNSVRVDWDIPYHGEKQD